MRVAKAAFPAVRSWGVSFLESLSLRQFSAIGTVFSDWNGAGLVSGNGQGTISGGSAEDAGTAESIKKGHLVTRTLRRVLRQSGKLCRTLGTENEGRYSEETG